MKPCKFLSFLFAAAFAFFFASAASAQTNAYDDAFHYSYNSASGFTNAYSGGFGFGPWVRSTNGPNSHGFFTTHNTSTAPFPSIASPTNYSSTNLPPTGSPPGNDNSQHVWGVFANGTGGPNAAAQFRAFSNSLDTTVAFKIDWQSDGIGPANTNMGGFSLRNGMATSSPSDFQTGLRFMFYYVGAASSNSFQIFDATGANPIGIPFTSAGLACEFTLEAGDTYRFVVKNATNGVILASVDGRPLAGSGTIDSVALFAQETSGGNQEFNFMQIVSTSLTPPTFANVLPATGSIYLSTAANNVSFEVDSLASTVASNGVKLLLNGVLQTNLLFNTLSPTAQLLVTNNTALVANTFYTYTIIAQDANGNLATNTANFNTFLASDLYIDAADYNFGAGQFIDSEPQDLYANLLGTNGVDYFEADLSGTNNVYRPGDLPQVLTLNTDATGDPIDHANERGSNPGNVVYNLGFTDSGDWDNYTRSVTVPTNYSIYARAASLTGGQFEIEKLVNPLATNTSQPLIPLGRVNVANTGGSRIYTGQLTPVVDIFGNTVVVPLSGTTTFRQTATASKVYNLEYFMLVPIANSTNTLRPYLSTANPAPAATGVTLDNPILFSIANRQTPLNPASVQVSLNGTNITGSGALATNTLGGTFSYSPPGFLPPNTTNTVQVIFADSASVSSTNIWQFVTLNIPNTLIPTAYAQPFNSGSTNGFGLTMFKIADSAPVVNTLSNAWNELAGLIIDTNSNAPYINLATNPVTGSSFSLDTNVIAFDITGAVTASFTFTNRSPFPYIPVTNLANNFVMQALTYLQLTNGAYHLAVRSDDGFELTTGPTPANTNTVLGLFDLGRGNATPTDIYFTIQTNGLYPMSLFYVQESSGGNIEFYSYKNGKPVLINDPTNANAIKAFAAIASSATPVTILGAAYNGGTASFHFTTQSGHTHFVEFKANLTDATWSPLQTVTGTGSSTNITDSTGGTTRFYRVRTQ